MYNTCFSLHTLINCDMDYLPNIRPIVFFAIPVCLGIFPSSLLFQESFDPEHSNQYPERLQSIPLTRAVSQVQQFQKSPQVLMINWSNVQEGILLLAVVERLLQEAAAGSKHSSVSWEVLVILTDKGHITEVRIQNYF